MYNISKISRRSWSDYCCRPWLSSMRPTIVKKSDSTSVISASGLKQY